VRGRAAAVRGRPAPGWLATASPAAMRRVRDALAPRAGRRRCLWAAPTEPRGRGPLRGRRGAPVTSHQRPSGRRPPLSAVQLRLALTAPHSYAAEGPATTTPARTTARAAGRRA